MRFKTGFVIGCAAGIYLTQKARQLRSPLATRAWTSAPASKRLAEDGSARFSEARAEKVLALGDLAMERAGDLVRGPLGDLARERVIALFEGAITSQRAEAGGRG